MKKLYVGTKRINALPMTRLEYNEFRCWTLPEAENGADEGYLVEYIDSPNANTDEYKGYVSWSPKEVFETEYQADGALSFGSALKLLKLGYKLTRRGWNGRRKDGSPMYVFLVDGSTFQVNRPPLNKMFVEGTTITYKPHLDMLHADDSVGVWVAVTNDILAEDWEIVQ